MLWLCICIHGNKYSNEKTIYVEWITVSSVLEAFGGKPIRLQLFHHMIITDIFPTLIALICTALVIYMNGLVGVLDLENQRETLVVKKRGGSVRFNLDQDIYDLGKEIAFATPGVPYQRHARHVNFKKPSKQYERKINFKGIEPKNDQKPQSMEHPIYENEICIPSPKTAHHDTFRHVY